MDKQKFWTAGHEAGLSAVIMAAAVCLSNVEIPFGGRYSSYLSGIVVQSSLCLLLLFLIPLTGKSVRSILGRPADGRSLLLVWPLFLVILMNLSDLLEGRIQIDMSRPVMVILYLAVYTSTGFFEEILCRGVILHLLLRRWGKSRKGIYGAVLWSGILFAAGHINGYLLGKMDLWSAAAQIFYAFFIGVCFAACYLRIRSLWVIIVIHALFDLSGELRELTAGGTVHPFMTSTPANALAGVLLLMPVFLYGLFILRKAEGSETAGSFSSHI